MEHPFKQAPCSCSSPTVPLPVPEPKNNRRWNILYFLTVALLTILWAVLYYTILPMTQWFLFSFLELDSASLLSASIEFFIYDTIKIFLLMLGLIYVIAWLRASINMARIRLYLMGKRRSVGYFLGASFGAMTPFCSCSSIPLFLGFTSARIPIGVSMAFLITSPLINEIAVVLLWGILGWKFTLTYVLVGMFAGILGGVVMDSLRAERWLRSFYKNPIETSQENLQGTSRAQKLHIIQRHNFALQETLTITKRIWKWVILGVALGATLHGFVPDNWFAEHFSAQQWWTVPASVLVAIPLYSNVTGIVPIMESLLTKGLPLGTTMAFCMSAVVASIPEFMMLRQIMTIKLQATFIAYLWIILTCIGYFLNFLSPWIV